MQGKNVLRKWIIIAVAVMYLLAACGPKETPTPEPTVDFVATLTAQVPTAAPPTATFTPLPTFTPAPVDALPVETVAATPVILYDEDGNPIEQSADVVYIDPLGDCYRLAILKTSPSENLSHLFMGQRFSITWTVQNVGYCEWKPGFKAVWGLGHKMDDPFDTLRDYIPAGGTTSFTLEFKAPGTAGDYSSYWHVINLEGFFFGVDLPVSITVIDPNVTPSVTPTKKPTKTPTPTKTKAP